jgi:hypothetical protein
MFIDCHIVNMGAMLKMGGERMALARLGRTRSHKHLQLDAGKLKRAQRALKAKTETETIERALDVVITEHVRNQLAAEANDRFVKSGVDIKDAYGALDK